MSDGRRFSSGKALLRDFDPRRSLVAGIIWLVVGLAASFAIAASIWAGGVAQEIVVQQHVRRLALETDQLSSDFGQAIAARLAAVRAASAEGSAPALFARLLDAYPDLGWIAVSDADGRIVGGDGEAPLGSDVSAKPWFVAGLKGAWIGAIPGSSDPHRLPVLGELSLPFTDSSGRTAGVIATRLNWHWASVDVQRLSTALNPRGTAQTLVLNGAGIVTVGPESLLGTPWNGKPQGESAPGAPLFEQLANGEVVLVARAPIEIAGVVTPNWQVQLSEPKEVVYQRANDLRVRIILISIFLGVATATLGALGARHLMNRLKALTRSAAAVGRNETARIEVPNGRDEVAQLARVFAKILDDLRQERAELLTLSSELERRVAIRTREVERLAEESRYAALARERLKIARDLHDTLAHSMMAMLSEIRLLRKIQVHDPDSLPDELARAEAVAQDGLNEARSAITQMRVSGVRDAGLGPALAKAVEIFRDRTGLKVEFKTDAASAGFGDERAETIFRMCEEALRNIERHAGASWVRIELHSQIASRLELSIEDDGIGFDTALPRPGHFGLIGLREQALLIGAELKIRSAHNQGTRLRLTLRMAPENL
jgi:signal transduction histidine kinase